MKDKEILAGVYVKAKTAATMPSTQDAGSIRNFIEEEWQKQDEQELVNQYNRNRPLEDHINDASEIGISLSESRHRGLEIEPDGTVTKII